MIPDLDQVLITKSLVTPSFLKSPSRVTFLFPSLLFLPPSQVNYLYKILNCTP